MMNLCFSLYENKFKKKPLPSLSSRKGLTNWRFLLKKINLQNSMFKVVRLISFARLRTGASALYFLVYEWIFLKENNDIDVGSGKHAF